jgi:hypothetical protein
MIQWGVEVEDRDRGDLRIDSVIEVEEGNSH